MKYMTVGNVLSYVDEVKANSFSRTVKLIWLGELEYRVQTDVMLLAAESVQSVSDDDSHELLAPAPWYEIYYDYLLMKISEHLEESSEQNNRAVTFDKAFTRFMRWWADTYAPSNGKAAFKGYYLKGDKGDPFEYEDFTAEQLAALKGYTPVRGTDYWTADDIAAIQSYIDDIPASSGSVVIEGTNSDDMSEVTISTPDAWTKISAAWNDTKHPAVILRLSNRFCAYLNAVLPADENEGQPLGIALFSFPPAHLAADSPALSIWLYENNSATVDTFQNSDIKQYVDDKLGDISTLLASI